jgi:hypothetical protein
VAFEFLSPGVTPMEQLLEYDQGQHRERWNPAHQDGVCLALSAYWIIANAAGRDFREWLGSAGAVGEAKSIYDLEAGVKRDTSEAEVLAEVWNARQARREAVPMIGKHRATGRPGHLSILLSSLGDRIARESRTLRAGARATLRSQSPRNLAGLLLLGEGYKLVNWRAASLAAAGNADAAHAVALHVTSSRVRFFEPNSGEWATTRGRDEFVPFFERTCACYGLAQLDLVSLIEFI